MKHVSYIAFCAILLCCPAVHSQPAITPITLSTADVKFLSDCGVRQDDINMIPKLPSAGQHKIMTLLRSRDRKCGDLDSFKNSRDYLRKYTPPPSKAPIPPKGYDIDFVTQAEFDYVSKINEDILMKFLSSPN